MCVESAGTLPGRGPRGDLRDPKGAAIVKVGRTLVIAGSQSLVACVLVGATAGAMTATGRDASASAPGVDWLPASTQLVIRIRISEMRTSSLFRRLMASKPMFRDEMAHIDRFAS